MIQPACRCEREIDEKEMLKRVRDVLRDYKGRDGALIPVLQITQGMFGYLPAAALREIAVQMGKPYSEVAGVVGFYSFFSTKPRGRHVVRVCLGTACYVRGGKQVLEAMKKNLGIDVGGTTPDRLFSLEVARCFGACGLAPAVMIGDDIHQRVKAARVSEILDPYRKPARAAKQRGRK